MPDHKNQHFVPRCVLKPFSLNGEGKAINLYTFGKRKLVPNAPLKNQCARDYWYGEDGKLEKLLASIESGYAAALKRVVEGTDTAKNRDEIRFFAFLQLRRTEMAAMRLIEAQEMMAGDLFGPGDRPPGPPREWFMLESLSVCVNNRDLIEDLKVRIVENRTPINFVTSDDPAVFTNRFAEQRLFQDTFGLSSSGLVLSMPLTPRLAVLCYDGLMYTIPSLVKQRMVVTSNQEIEIFNELQFLKASSSVYFEPWADAGYVRDSFERARDRRPSSWVSIKHMFYLGKENGHERYQEGTLQQAKESGQSLMMMSFKYPAPSSWLSQLKFRDKPRTYYNGSAVGHVRKEEWLRGLSAASPFHTRRSPFR